METADSKSEMWRMTQGNAGQIFITVQKKRVLITIDEKNKDKNLSNGSFLICGTTFFGTKTSRARSVLHDLTNLIELDYLIRLYWSSEVVGFFCLAVPFFSLQVISLRLFVWSYLSVPTAAGSFCVGRLMLLTVRSILAAQPRPLWLGSQILSGFWLQVPIVISSFIISVTNMLHLFSWRLWVFAVAIWSRVAD